MSLRVKFESNSGKYPVDHNWLVLKENTVFLI